MVGFAQHSHCSSIFISFQHPTHKALHGSGSPSFKNQIASRRNNPMGQAHKKKTPFFETTGLAFRRLGVNKPRHSENTSAKMRYLYRRTRLTLARLKRPRAMENPILILHVFPRIVPFLPDSYVAVSLAQSAKSDVLSTGTARALFRGLPLPGLSVAGAGDSNSRR